MKYMRKLIVSMNITLDGYVAGPDGELDWHHRCWNEEMARCATEELGGASTLLFGRKTYSAMAGYWPGKLRDFCCRDEDLAFADMINNREKIVFSKTLEETCWNNSRLAQSDLSRVVLQLKKQTGKDILVYGSATLVSELLRRQLIDEYALWLHPVMLGKGKLFFKPLNYSTELQLYQSTVFKTGVTLLRYGPIG